MSKTHRYLVTTAGSLVNSRTVHKQKLALVIQKQESVTKPSVMVAVLQTPNYCAAICENPVA